MCPLFVCFECVPSLECFEFVPRECVTKFRALDSIIDHKVISTVCNTMRRQLYDQISQRNRNRIRKYCSLFIRGPRWGWIMKKTEVENLVTHSLYSKSVSKYLFLLQSFFFLFHLNCIFKSIGLDTRRRCKGKLFEFLPFSRFELNKL